jgi:hypothetical protein
MTVDNKFFIDWLFFIKKEIEAGIIFLVWLRMYL